MKVQYFQTATLLTAFVNATAGINVISITYDTQSATYVLFFN